MAAPPTRLLTVAEVARALRCSSTSVYRRVWDGQLEARRVGETGPLRIEPEAVWRLLQPIKPHQEEDR